MRTVIAALAFCIVLCPLCASAQVPTAPVNACDANREYRRFDFWVGEWDVIAGGRPAGTSSIQLILNNCVVFENWTGARGYIGKSFNFYNSQTKKWNQVWVDGSGQNIQFEGEFRQGNLYYTATTVDPDTGKTLHKLTFFNQGRDQVRQLWEQSTDEGKTWKVVFDGTYKRKK